MWFSEVELAGATMNDVNLKKPFSKALRESTKMKLQACLSQACRETSAHFLVVAWKLQRLKRIFYAYLMIIQTPVRIILVWI